MITMPDAKAAAPGLIAAAGNAEGPRYSATFVTIRQAPKPSQKLRRLILAAPAIAIAGQTGWLPCRTTPAKRSGAALRQSGCQSTVSLPSPNVAAAKPD